MGISCVKGCRLVLMIIAIGAGACCQRPPNTSSGVTVEFQIKPKPVRAGPVVVFLTLTDATNDPVTGAQIEVEGDMSHAGMSPVFAQVNEVQPGRYESHLSLAMAGDWVILLHGTLPNGEKLERQFDVKDVRPN